MPFSNKKAAIIPSGINPASVMRGAGLLGGAAAKSIPTMGGGLMGGLGFGMGSKVTDLLSKSTLGLKPLIIAAIFDTFVFFSGEINLLAGVIFHIVFTFLLINNLNIKSRFLGGFLFVKIGALIYLFIYSVAPTFIPIQVHEFALLTFLNHALFAYTIFIIFTGVISNRTGGWVVTVIYWVAFVMLIFFAYDQAKGEINDALAKYGLEIPESTQEQRSVIINFLEGLVSSTKNTGGTVLQGIKNFPQSIGNFINPKISAAGGEALFGTTKEEQPKLGIVLEPHPSGATTLKEGDNEFTIVRALITIPNPLEDRSFLTVTGIRCYHMKSRSDAEIEANKILEYPEEALQKGVNVFYNRPLTVSCEFNTKDLKGVSTVNLEVGYDFSSNAKLITYVMKDDLLEDLLIRNEDPLDYIAVPSNKRNPSTKYDNGPARFGIGPVELNNPPLGIRDKKIYPNFELVIGNKASDFNGYIGKVNNIFVTLPRGFSLTEGDTCLFEKSPDDPNKPDGSNKYSIKEKAMEAKSTDFTNIKTSRLFTCPMEVDTTKALGAASFSQVEFNVDADFTYETKTELSTKPRS